MNLLLIDFTDIPNGRNVVLGCEILRVIREQNPRAEYSVPGNLVI